MEVKFSVGKRSAIAALKAGLVPMLHGSPGIGKSQMAYEIAEEFNLQVIDVRLSQCDPTDLLGFPQVNGKRAGYLPMDTFPLEGDSLPEGKSGWLLFMDECNSAPLAVQAASYKVFLDRMVGNRKLHPLCAVMAAGNKESDGAIVMPMSTALQSRMIHIELMVDHEEWLDWANGKAIDHRICSAIRFKPGWLMTFSPDHTDKTYGCPRTWAFVNKLLPQTEGDDTVRLVVLSGALSEGLAREFLTYCKVYREIPQPDEILKSPESAKVPTDPGYLYPVIGTISHNAKLSNFEQFMKYIRRMPKEYQVVTVRDTKRRNPEILKLPATVKWMDELGAELF
jgi:hypothetical protein